MNSTQEKITNEMNWARWIARIISSSAIIIWGWWFLADLITEFLNEGTSFDPTSSEVVITIFFIIVLAGTIIGWWNEKWGGVILIIGYTANAVGGYIMAVSVNGAPVGYFVGFIPVIIFLPFLISGILYINVWQKKKKLIK